MAWIAYQTESPIDFGWAYLSTAEEAAGKIAAAEVDNVLFGLAGETGSAITRFLIALSEARRLAHERGWEGDFRKGYEPRVFWLPGEGEFQYAFAWKQDNNGETFIVSPVKLPWLNDVA